MPLGKRSRPPMMRTTSMAEFAADLAAPRPPQIHQPSDHERAHQQRRERRRAAAVEAEARSAAAAAPPPPPGALVETAPFLMACGLCKRRLGPSRDIFMYRGDIAFCSLECRQMQMNLDERKAKCSMTLTKMSSNSTAASGSGASGSGGGGSGGESVAAA